MQRTSILSLTFAAILASLATAEEPVSFRKDLGPLLLDRCLACHGPKKAEGGFRVDSFERVTKRRRFGIARFYR